MNWLGWIGRTLNLKQHGSFFSNYFGGGPSWSGETMNADKAMHIATVWKCINLIAGTLGSLPLRLVAADGSGREAPQGVAVGQVISDSANDEQPSLEFWESIIGCQELVGNGFARKHFSGSGPSRQVIALTLLNPYRMGWEKKADQPIVWRYTDDDGRQTEIPRDEVFHLRGFSFDGVMGLSTVSYGAQQLGVARAADRTAAQVFSSGLSSSGFLETQSVLDEPDRLRLQKIMDEYRGAGGVGKIMILEGGMKYNQISMTSEDSELLTSRKWNVEEMCRMFDVPPVLAGHNPEGGTSWGSGVEQVILAWYQLGLRRRIRKLEAAIRKQLLSPAERTLWTPKMNIDALLQGDSTARSALLTSYVQNGVMNRNEARAKENLPAYTGGEVFTAQVNLAPVNQLGQTSTQDAVAVRQMLRNFLGVEDAPRPPLQIEHKP